MIVFNALQTSLNGGIGRYSYELAKGMYELNRNDIKIVIRNEDKEQYKFVDEEDLIIAFGINNSKDRNIYEQFKLPKIIYKKFPNAIIHYPDTMAPLLAKNKVVITVHDLAFKSLKGAFTWKAKLWKNIITDLSIKKASRIIAITNFTKSEILKYYTKIEKEKINVVYNGFNNFSKEPIIEELVSDKVKNIKKPYILTVSTISPRKNIDGLIKAFNEIKDKLDENLVIAGNKGWMYESVYKIVDELNLKNRVIFTGKVNDEELKYLYKNSKIFVYVSFYEGFGLPPLEAMSYNIPCIVSNTSCIPEVVGDEAIKVDPSNIENIADTIIEFVIKEGVSNKKKITKNRQILKFSWNKCAKETLEFIKLS